MTSSVIPTQRCSLRLGKIVQNLFVMLYTLFSLPKFELILAHVHGFQPQPHRLHRVQPLPRCQRQQTPVNGISRVRRKEEAQPLILGMRSLPLLAHTTNGSSSPDDFSPTPYKDHSFPMKSQSRFSHVMLKVRSVEETVQYWTSKGGRIRTVTHKPGTSNGESFLQSAWIELGSSLSTQLLSSDDSSTTASNTDGNSRSMRLSNPNQMKENIQPVSAARPDDTHDSFALELVRSKSGSSPDSSTADSPFYDVGNVISYIGVSMLLQFQNNLVGAITGEKPQQHGMEPNGIPVKSSAAAPGDYLSRFCLKSNDLVASENFYTTILGMETKAMDDRLVCLRYPPLSGTMGVPTTLVFERTEEALELGDCFDHLAIATRVDVNELFLQLQEQSPIRFWMKPTKMFGRTVLGVLDPNGYKVVIASEVDR